MAKIYNYKNYALTHQDNGAVNVTKDGVEQSNSKAALKEIAAIVGFEVEEKWNSYQIGTKLINFLVAKGLVESEDLEKKVEGSAAEVANAKVRVYGKAQNRTALGIVHAYMIMYPHAKLEDLRKAFPNSLNPSREIFAEYKGSADDDKFRVAYITEFLCALSKAIDLGVDVKGYCYWSLLDNYEWHSFKPRFGLVDVDRMGDFKRTIKPSGYYLKEIIKNNGFKPEILKKYLTEQPRVVYDPKQV
jgi:beta-glucosidase/6-phospho-beta-glucosidase/beta-galactosidase